MKNCMSGVSASGSARVIIPPVITPIAIGPRRRNTYFMPVSALRHTVRSSSLVVTGRVHLYMTRNAR